jgi:Fic family protein
MILFNHPSQMEPMLPSEAHSGELFEAASDLLRHAHQLSAKCRPEALEGLRELLRAMNSYYSNRIEGQHTLPVEIEQALRANYSTDVDKAYRQRLALAHMATEQQLEKHWDQWSREKIWASQTISEIHQDLFARLPTVEPGTVGVAPIHPGAWRDQQVKVGEHIAPDSSCLASFMSRWSQVYAGARRGEMAVLAAAASHHRLTWIHPFNDGNGRVARLHLLLVIGQLGLSNGLWSPLRGFARQQKTYYHSLALADQPRQGDLDGRGNLSEKYLIGWIRWVLEVCLDQVQFMREALDLDRMQDRISACLSYEQEVVKQGVRREALRPLHYLFAMQGSLKRSDFKAMLGLGERLASAQISALLARGLLRSPSAYGDLSFGVPQHALRFYFPRLWPEAESAGH